MFDMFDYMCKIYNQYVEMEEDGKFKYRSLPNNICMDKLITTINNYTFKN